jgi:hypothetical protein
VFDMDYWSSIHWWMPRPMDCRYYLYAPITRQSIRISEFLWWLDASVIHGSKIHPVFLIARMRHSKNGTGFPADRAVWFVSAGLQQQEGIQKNNVYDNASERKARMSVWMTIASRYSWPVATHQVSRMDKPPVVRIPVWPISCCMSCPVDKPGYGYRNGTGHIYRPPGWILFTWANNPISLPSKM